MRWWHLVHVVLFFVCERVSSKGCGIDGKKNFRIRSLQKQNLAKKKIIFDKIDKTHFTRFNLIIFSFIFFF